MTAPTDLEIFANVARLGNMSSAARGMGLSPAVVSKRISILEAKLGAKLFQRTTRQLTLTNVGSGFYKRVSEILNLIEEAEDFVGKENRNPAGLLRVSTHSLFARKFIIPNLSDFRQSFPGIELELILSDEPVDLIRDGFDVSLRLGKAKGSSLVSRHLLRMERHLYASAAYVQRRGSPLSPRDLQRHDCLHAGGEETWHLEDLDGRQVAAKIGGALRFNSSIVVQDALLEGLGIALQSEWELPASPAGRSGRLSEGGGRGKAGGKPSACGGIVRVLDSFKDSRSTGIYAVYTARDYVPAKISAFIDFYSGLLAGEHTAGTQPDAEWRGLALHAKAAE